ncbi:HIT domain-containing protein [Kineococcus sp. SYSU DK003]|uniref:HIT domain-containing protein n=1 Tax=Kineococcus sp. SYSU DK003 TaxID=3383124 RepID=UPI003D7CF186
MSAATDDACILCRLIDGRLETSRVDEDQDVVAFRDYQPVNPGHVLVAPRQHAPLLEDLDEATASPSGGCGEADHHADLHEEPATAVWGLIGDPTRARVLYALDLVEELGVGDVALALGLNDDAVSCALRVLRTAGLVGRRKQGRVVFHRPADGFPEPLPEHCLRRLSALTRTAPMSRADPSTASSLVTRSCRVTRDDGRRPSAQWW